MCRLLQIVYKSTLIKKKTPHVTFLGKYTQTKYILTNHKTKIYNNHFRDNIISKNPIKLKKHRKRIYFGDLNKD